MMLRYLSLLFLLPACALARSSEPESVKLVNACNELVRMYERDGQENKLVSWFGSVFRLGWTMKNDPLTAPAGGRPR